MIVEFVGSTGAGKTTLIDEVRHNLAESVGVTTSYGLVAEPLGLSAVAHPTVRNLVQEITALPLLLPALRRQRAFVSFTLRMLARQADLSIFTVNILRSLVRKLGEYEIGRRRQREGIVLVDEGTVLAAHNLFVYSSAVYTTAEIDKFAALVPLPDVIVYVRAPLESMVNRSLRRCDLPRELGAKSRTEVKKCVERATDLFDQLTQAERLRSRTLIVENPDASDKGREATVDDISDRLRQCYRLHQQNGLRGAFAFAASLPEVNSHAD